MDAWFSLNIMGGNYWNECDKMSWYVVVHFAEEKVGRMKEYTSQMSYAIILNVLAAEYSMSCPRHIRAPI